MARTYLERGPAGAVVGVALVLACGRAAAPPMPPTPPPGAPADSAPRLPPIPPVEGPLRLDVGYPPEGAAIAARDSNFIFGSTGTGRAVLRINGASVEVAPNGAFLAFLPVPPDGVYHLQAVVDGESAELTRTVRVPAPVPDPPAEATIADGSVYPRGALALPHGEPIEVGFRGTAGGRAWLITPDGQRVLLVEDPVAHESGAADHFRTAPRPADTGQRGWSWYRASVVPTTDWVAADTAVARPMLAATSHAMRPVGDANIRPGAPLAGPSQALLALTVDGDTATLPLPLNVAVLPPTTLRVGEAFPPEGAEVTPDWTIRGRPYTSGPYHYFWPAGTRLQIDAERNGMYRVRLSESLAAWVPAADVRLLPSGTRLPRGVISGARFAHAPEWVELRVATPQRLPYHVIENGRRLTLDVFGATSAINFFQYGGLDALIEHAAWQQPAEHVFRVNIDLSRNIWGWEAFYDERDALVLRIRRPPPIDPERPLAGKVIVVDPGHGGADSTTIGPTRLTEADANLMVARRLAPMLEAAGARVIMTRRDRSGVDLAARPRMARDSNAHALVSLHNNAFPDGVNPFENAGTSVYYYHPHSADMARLFQRELLDALGTRDIGYGRADLALVRPTWMPAVLTETMFMMIPEHEAALRDAGVQERIARAHLAALEEFFRSRAER